jgi:hypothetical protein
MREDILNIGVEIIRATEELNSFEVGDEMYDERLEALSRLLDIRRKMLDEEERQYKVQIEEKERERNERIRVDKEIFERNERIERSEKENIHRYIGYAINIAGIALPLICYGAWFKAGLTFEETGVYTSGMLKGLMNKMQPKIN